MFALVKTDKKYNPFNQEKYLVSVTGVHSYWDSHKINAKKFDSYEEAENFCQNYIRWPIMDFDVVVKELT